MVITKGTDPASPLLYQMLASNENIIQATLRFWRPSATGTDQQYYVVTLTNAAIASVHLDTATEEISLIYQKIQWTCADGGIPSQDTWSR